MPALIFDYDGLMVDTERVMAECVVELLAEVGARVTIADFGHLFGSTEVDDEWERLLHHWCGATLTIGELESRLGPVFLQRAADLPLLPGVEALLESAAADGWGVGLATGERRERLLKRLEQLGVLGRFDAIVTAAEVARGKPAPDIFLAVAERLDVEPAQCVVLEDSVPGCKAALAAGMQAVVCPSLVSAHCEFPAAARRVTSLADLTLHDLNFGSR